MGGLSRHVSLGLFALLALACGAGESEEKLRAARSVGSIAAPVASATAVPQTTSSSVPAEAPPSDIALELARGVAHEIDTGADTHAVLASGNGTIDGEWSFAIRQMGALGLAEVMLAKPETQAELLPSMRRALEEMVAPSRLAFAKSAWGGESGLDSLDGDHGHAYLGYAALSFCMARAVDPSLPSAALSDRITDALARRTEGSPHGIIETYPDATFPPDMSLVVGAIGLCDRVSGKKHREALAKGIAGMRAFIDPKTGFLVQRVDARTGAHRDVPRGSGTALASFALAFADNDIAAALDRALADRGDKTYFGLGGVREYPEGVVAGPGDADSGPLVFGMSPVATAFGIGGARAQGEDDRADAFLRSADTVGSLEHVGAMRFYRAGGALADAILLAMTAAGPMTVRACAMHTAPCPTP